MPGSVTRRHAGCMASISGFRTYVLVNVVEPLTRRPRPTDWPWLAFCVPYGVAALALGLGSGLFTPGLPRLWELAVIPPLLILYPSLIEESVFRGLLLPASLAESSVRRQVGAVALSTGLFVAMHPLNHWLIRLSDTSAFTDPVFLVIVTLLGLTCAVQRLKTGSLWLPIATHWATVVVWNLFLGRDLSF